MTISTIMKETLHTISQGMLVPIIVILIFLIAVSVASVGSILAELFIERRYKGNIPELISDINGKKPEAIEGLIRKARLLKRQKNILYELLKRKGLPEAELEAIAKKLISNEEAYYQKIRGRTEIVARIAPMFGLMGTLIPLGPGLIALGQGDTQILAQSLLTGFDTTVAGLASAAVCFVISRVRKRWYEGYMVSLESLMTCIMTEVYRDEEQISPVRLA